MAKEIYEIVRCHGSQTNCEPEIKHMMDCVTSGNNLLNVW